MSIPVSYLSIVIIWSTTPLAIAWSAESVTPIASLGLRMVVAAMLGWVILRVLGIKISWRREAVLTYLYSQLGIVGAMVCVYSSSQFIASGLISVLFALSPILSSIFAVALIGRQTFGIGQIAAFLTSFAGLAFVFIDSLVLSDDSWKGIALLLAGVSLYSLSGVLVQSVGYRGNPLSTTVASVMVSVPLFFVVWWTLDGVVPQLTEINTSVYAILYLAVFGSLLGFCAYFYLLRESGASTVASITLITPVMAMILGAILNDETISLRVYIGTFFILLGLVLYHRELFGYRERGSQSVAS